LLITDSGLFACLRLHCVVFSFHQADGHVRMLNEF
jgi:hypothetical protein